MSLVCGYSFIIDMKNCPKVLNIKIIKLCFVMFSGHNSGACDISIVARNFEASLLSTDTPF